MKFAPALRWFLPVVTLLAMALRIPIQTPWIDEAAIVTSGARAWGIAVDTGLEAPSFNGERLQAGPPWGVDAGR